MIVRNGINYEKFIYRHIRTRENNDKTSTEEVVDQFYIYNNEEVDEIVSGMNVPISGLICHKFYNNMCQEWVEIDGRVAWKHLEYVMGFVDLNQN